MQQRPSDSREQAYVCSARTERGGDRIGKRGGKTAVIASGLKRTPWQVLAGRSTVNASGEDTDDHELFAAAIGGTVAGLAAGVLVPILLLFFCRRRSRKPRARHPIAEDKARSSVVEPFLHASIEEHPGARRSRASVGARRLGQANALHLGPPAQRLDCSANEWT